MAQSESQKRAEAKYRQKEEVKTSYAKYVKEKFKTVAACYKRPEAEYIAEIFAAHGVTPAQVIRGAAAALLDGQPIRTESEPLPIPSAPEADRPAEATDPAED